MRRFVVVARPPLSVLGSFSILRRLVVGTSLGWGLRSGPSANVDHTVVHGIGRW